MVTRSEVEGAPAPRHRQVPARPAPRRATAFRRTGVAHVWTVDLTDARWDVDHAASTLTADELVRADRAAPAVRRRRVLLRAALRRVLADALGTTPEAVPLVVVDGRPLLPHGLHRFGLSCSAHAGAGLVALTSGAPVGIDLQGVPGEALARAGAEGWLTSRELQGIARLDGSDQAVAIARCWTQKEAVLKAETVGLRRSPATVETPLAPVGRSGRWWLRDLPAPVGSVASLAVAGRRAPRVVTRSLSPVGVR